MDANDQRDSSHRHIVTSESCFNDSTIKRFNVAKPFWRNVVLIALAHVALIAGLIRWSVAARASPSPESIVWLDGAADLSAGEPEKQESPAPKQQPSGTEYNEPAQMGAVSAAMERAVGETALSLESQMILLATAVSGSPFLGLLGTVWGVMDAFTGVAEAGSPNLVAMAPGVSGALITTVTALCVAIPAMFGYNFLVTSIRGMIVEMDNFAAELASEFEHKYVDHGSRESTFRR